MPKNSILIYHEFVIPILWRGSSLVADFDPRILGIHSNNAYVVVILVVSLGCVINHLTLNVPDRTLQIRSHLFVDLPFNVVESETVRLLRNVN